MNNEQIVNKVIEETTKRLKNKQSSLIFDNTPTENSNNLVTSDGVKKYIDAKPEGGSVIVANPKLSGNEDNLVGIQVDKTKYKIKEGTQVEPELETVENVDTVKTMQIDNTNYIVKDDNVSTVIPKSVKSELNKFTDTWETKSWTGLTYFNASYMWTDGEDIYYSSGGTQYVLNKITSTWNVKTWNGLVNFFGYFVWTDGNNIYCSYRDIFQIARHYVLDKSTSTWSEKTWYGLTDFIGGTVWTDGTNIYTSERNNEHYVLDKESSTWSRKNWTGLTDFSGLNIWTDGDDIYMSNAYSHYVLDKATSTWNKKIWNGLNFFYNTSIWTDGENIYYSNYLGGINYQYILDKSTSTWKEKTWNELSNVDGDKVWTDGKNIYYSDGNNQYVLKKNTLSQTKPVLSDELEIKANPELSGNEEELTGIQIDNVKYKMPEKPVVSNVIPSDTRTELSRFGDTWENKVWPSDIRVSSEVWTDGNNIYNSNGRDQYILDKATNTWNVKTWYGLTDFMAQRIWTDGNNIYYSLGSSQYVLDKSTSTWTQKTWTGLTNFIGNATWTDGENIYYSLGTNHYVLNKSTSTWITKTWSGLTGFDGTNIWTDGDNIYYSSGSTQFVLDKSTSTWNVKIWTGLTNFYGTSLWTDGNNIYYSAGGQQYFLNKENSTWKLKIWKGLTNFHAINVWTDGENIYCSDPSIFMQYILLKPSLSSASSILKSEIYANKTSVEVLPRLYSLKIDDKNYKLTFNDLKVSNLTESSGILSWTAPDLTKYTDYTPNVSYLIYINDTLIDETSNTSYDASAQLTSGTYNINIVVKFNLQNDEDKDITITI